MGMIHKIHDSIAHLATPLEQLIILPGNPRIGDINAIAASYDEFGQVRPIVVRPNDDGTSTIIAGNHQFQAARQLGWTHIAVVQMEADDVRAMAFAIADNRTNELGHTDDSLLHEALGGIIEEYGDLLEDLAWDEFELAMLDITSERDDIATPGYYEQPVITPLLSDEPRPNQNIERPQVSPISSVDSAGETVLEAPKDADTAALVTQGATTARVAGTSKTVVQYSLVFDNPEQQRRWYDFLRWLRNDPAGAGETTAEKLIDFLEQHANF